MKTIHKFTLTVTDEQTIRMPKGAKILHVGEQLGKVCLWAEVDTDKEMENRTFYIRGTGNQLTGKHGKHLGTVPMAKPSTYVWHVYEG